ncbi:type II toxin-antitoxin system PemK/MazF family toxin [Phormidium sp. FACHB-592]|uniref:Type II toxin-antitoxin system PemK/MazF family toxin n=1 Tax=Stenomitos frigidus AS-A4 TaxID=2933935 RepID=A0ABV0KFE0_9CYAN|nr:type II toxin-antitoxin system PemK/MazF family toxin [Phormidium sp. FACHB-592]MBD2076515.1 type II toxin-antitoxin system PemK/MazF family toxin [Phormidium sp. FACHB-592]
MITTMQLERTLKQGDVVLVLFPNANLTTAKTRPAVVVQADNLRTGLSQVIVAMVTSQMFRAGHPSRVTILLDSVEGQQSGLLTNSVVMTDNLATITLSAISRTIGSLLTTEVNTALKHTFGLD